MAFRTLLKLFLSLSLVVTAYPGYAANDERLQTSDSQTRHQLLNKVVSKQFTRKSKKTILKEKIEKDFNQQISKFPDDINRAETQSVIKHVGQTYTLIFVLAMVEEVKRLVYDDYINHRYISPQQITEKAGIAAEHILDSGEIFSSLSAGAATHVAFKVPLAVFNAAIENTQSRLLFKRILQSLTGSFITFFGWELGGQLWQEAKTLISRNELPGKEYDFFFEEDALWSYLLKGNPNAAKIVGLLMNSMFKVLWTDEALTAQWIYNGLRHRIMSGEFVTMVTAMGSVSAVGATVCPQCGAGAMIGFGILGGILSGIVPEMQNNQLTYFLKDGWLSVLEKNKLKRTTELLTLTPPRPEILKERAGVREKIVDVHLERINKARLKVDEIVFRLQHYRQNLMQLESKERMQKAIAADEQELETYQRWMQEAELDLVMVYVDEINFFKDLLARRTFTLEITSLLEQEILNNRSIKNHFCSVVEGLRLVHHANLQSLQPKVENYLVAACKISAVKPLTKFLDLSPEQQSVYDDSVANLMEFFVTSFDEYKLVLARVKAALNL